MGQDALLRAIESTVRLYDELQDTEARDFSGDGEGLSKANEGVEKLNEEFALLTSEDSSGQVWTRNINELLEGVDEYHQRDEGDDSRGTTLGEVFTSPYYTRDRVLREVWGLKTRLESTKETVEEAEWADETSYWQAQGRLEEILAQNKYGLPNEARSKSVEAFGRLINWFWDRVTGLFEGVGSRLGEGTRKVIVLILFIVLVVLSTVLLVRFLPYLGLMSKRTAHKKVRSKVRSLVGPSLMEYLRLAEKFEKEGAYLDSLRHYHLVIITELEERGLIPKDRSRTDRENLGYLKQRTPRNGIAARFGHIVDWHDRAVYGKAGCTRIELGEFKEETRSLVQGLAEGGAGP